MLPTFTPNSNPNQPCFYLSDLSSPIFSFYILCTRDARTQRPELEWRVRAGASCVENDGVEQEADAHLEALAIAGTAGWHAGVPSKHAP